MTDFIEPSNPPKVAVIREAECIGCTKCITACPFDSIMGAAKFMHTVITELCTGCGLCVEPCPVDCIDIIPAPEKTEAEQAIFTQQARQRFDFHISRMEKERIRDRERYLQAKQAGQKNKTLAERKAEINAILARTRKGSIDG